MAYQVRRDPLRRGDWFFTPDALLAFEHSFQSSQSFALRGITLYPPKFGLGLLMSFRPTHILAAGWDTPLSVCCASYTRALSLTAAFWVESNASTTRRSGGLAQALKRYVLESGQGVLVPTHKSLELVRSISHQELVVTLLPNPVALARLRELPAAEKRMLFIGELSARKGFDTFIEACARGQETGWTGAAWGDDSAGLAAAAPPNCSVNPAMPLEDLIPEFRTTDIWTIPSRRDPAPLTYSEALALGIRVSVSDAVAYAGQAAETAGAGVHRASDASSLLRSAEALTAAPRPGEHAAQSVSEATWAHAILDLLLEGRGTS